MARLTTCYPLRVDVSVVVIVNHLCYVPRSTQIIKSMTQPSRARDDQEEVKQEALFATGELPEALGMRPTYLLPLFLQYRITVHLHGCS